MKLGKKAMEALQAEITGQLQNGDVLVVMGAVGLKGTAAIVEKGYDVLCRYFSKGFLEDCRKLLEHYGIGEDAEHSEAWKMAQEAGASALCVIEKAGILSVLWKMAEASQMGLSVDLRKIPIRQETIEVCERYHVNPYRLLSGSAILLGIRGGEALVQACHQQGIPAAVIGQIHEGNERLLFSGANSRYLERPSADEMEKIKWQD